MGMLSQKTIKCLFAISGNQCAFPGCDEILCDDSGNVFGEICHIKASRKGGARYDPIQTAKERNAVENLILLCPTHHKLVDLKPDQFTAESLIAMKNNKGQYFGHTETKDDEFYAKRLLEKHQDKIIEQNIMVNSPGAIQSHSVTVKTTGGKVIFAPSPGTIGHDQRKSRYIGYLIKKYNDYAKKYYTREKTFSNGAIATNIESNFGATWRMLPIELFDEVVAYLLGRISKTQQAKINKGKNIRAFSTFDEYCLKHGF